MFTASCLCRSVSFEISSPLSEARYCHCENCRKFSGTGSAPWAITELKSLNVTSVAAPINKYQSGGGTRCFCNTCGSPLWFESKLNPAKVAIPLGVIDSGDVPKPQSHIWTQSCPVWYDIPDNLEQFTTNP